MKITKLIIPILGLSQINNKELLQIEKTPEISYEVLAKDNWDNYYLVDANATEIQNKVIQLNTQKNEIRGLRPISCANCQDGCWQGYLAACRLCVAGFWNPAIYAGCIGACWSGYLICMAACN